MKAMEDNHWWRMYGPFDAGEDDLPHAGQVISHYARLSGLTASDLARRLTQRGWKVGERRVEQLQAQANVSDSQQISRRHANTGWRSWDSILPAGLCSPMRPEPRPWLWRRAS
jgi:hypothetical protein